MTLRSPPSSRPARVCRALGAALRVAVLTVGLANAAGAQSGSLSLGQPLDSGSGAQILVLDFDRLFEQSAFGQRLSQELEEARAALAAENRAIEAELTEEEQTLTNTRDTMSAEDFRGLADAFDEKVQRLRREQDAKARALNQRGEDVRRVFLTTAEPVLNQLMIDAGAQVILERRTVFAVRQEIDITERAITAMNDTIGDGARTTP